MAHKLIITLDKPEGELIELTAEELAIENEKQEIARKENEEHFAMLEKRITDKASAKAKLIAGEPLTEDEANTIVL